MMGTVSARITMLVASVGVAAGCGRGGGSATVTTTQTVTAGSAGASNGLEAQYVAVVRQVAPSVVQIQTSAGLGSGEILDADGNIVTNAHVVGSAKTFKVTLSNGRQYDGKLVGVFSVDDLAVIRIQAPGLRPIGFASSAQLEVGDIVLAVGSPLGLQSSVTEGIVSALGRTVNEPTGTAVPGAIQTSAAINPGNSGGALVNLDGRLVGIPTLAASSPAGGAAAGIGFAIPSDTVRKISRQLIRYGHVVSSHRAYLGVRLSDTQGEGVYVAEVTPGGPAAKAGIQVGDVITSVANQATPTGAALSSAVASLKPGQTAEIAVTRPDGMRDTVTVTFGEYPGG
jgi:S1-C subfamily serine protease